MNLYKILERESRKKKKTIIFPESYDRRVLDAVNEILKRRISRVILIAKEKDLETLIAPQRNLIIVDSKFSVDFLKEFYELKLKKDNKYDIRKAEKDLKDSLTFSCLLLKNKFADGIIAGSVYSTSDVLRNAISIIGPSKNNKTISSFFLFSFPTKHRFSKKVFAYADCGVIPNPTPEQLSDIAIQTSINFKKITGLQPRVAFLSFSTKGSAKDSSIEKINEAISLTKKKNHKLVCDGELQFDTAFDPHVAKRKNPDGLIKGDANVFIFPDLNSGNIAYKITERLAGAQATGPIVQGLAKPVMDLSRGCSSKDIINMTNVAVNL